MVNREAIIKLIKARNPCISDSGANREARFIAGHAELEIHKLASKLCKNCKGCVVNGKSSNS